MRQLTIYIFLTCFIFGSGQVLGQISVHPVKKDRNSRSKPTSNNAREKEDSPLSLPFWDDFSFTNNQPSDSLWENSNNIYVNNGLGLKPPSLGVASFDGLQESGNPYHVNPASMGPTDALTSRPIDLSNLTVASNVYISFFYQHSGHGEAPDDTDSLRLEFKNIDGEWISIWPAAQELNTTGEFVQVLQKVGDASFFHDHFQFKFQSFGRQSGPFDVWNVDYVYVNKGRSASDTAYPDRTISTPMTSPFGSYTSIPYNHFDIANLSPITIGFYSLDNINDLPQPFTAKIYADIQTYNDSATHVVIEDSVATDPLFPQKYVSITKLSFLKDSLFTPTADSVRLNMKFVIDASDNDTLRKEYFPEIYAPIDFRNNDTTRSSFMLSSYYAYDDGSAEYGAGYEAAGGRLAYKFEMAKNAPDTAYMVAVDMYFPYINADPGGKSIDLMIMRDLKQNAGSLLHRQRATIVSSPAINSFVRYELIASVLVSDTFYIAYKQNSTELYVGLDKNTDSKDKIYYNLDGNWSQNTLVEGSLMIRPVFGFPSDEEILASDPTVENPVINIFPNPSSGLFRIQGKFDEVKIYDIRGVEQVVPISFENGEANFNLAHQPDGVYILQFISGNSLETVKVIKNSF